MELQKPPSLKPSSGCWVSTAILMRRFETIFRNGFGVFLRTSWTLGEPLSGPLTFPQPAGRCDHFAMLKRRLRFSEFKDANERISKCIADSLWLSSRTDCRLEGYGLESQGMGRASGSFH